MQISKIVQNNKERKIGTPKLFLGLLKWNWAQYRSILLAMIAFNNEWHLLDYRLNKGEGLDACLYNIVPGFGNKKKVSKADLAVLPQFIRFGHVFLVHVINSKWASSDLSSQRVMEKCEQFQQHLQLVKKALDHSTTIQFDFCINRFETSCFLGPPQLLNYIRT